PLQGLQRVPAGAGGAAVRAAGRGRRRGRGPAGPGGGGAAGGVRRGPRFRQAAGRCADGGGERPGAAVQAVARGAPGGRDPGVGRGKGAQAGAAGPPRAGGLTTGGRTAIAGAWPLLPRTPPPAPRVVDGRGGCAPVSSSWATRAASSRWPRCSCSPPRRGPSSTVCRRTGRRSPPRTAGSRSGGGFGLGGRLRDRRLEHVVDQPHHELLATQPVAELLPREQLPG